MQAQFHIKEIKSIDIRHYDEETTIPWTTVHLNVVETDRSKSEIVFFLHDREIAPINVVNSIVAEINRR